MIDIRAANPRLYEHVEELDRLRTLRTQLLYLRAYLFTCSSESEAADTLRSMFKSREHFYEHVHLYSVSDLLLVARGGLLFEVQEAVCFSELHVRDCKRCTARGFVCEVCRSNDVIFPFQLHIAQTCPDCCAVYHRSCAPRLTDCPRCVRRRQRRLKERDDFEEENYSALDHLENENLPVEKNDQHDIGEKCDNTLTSKELKSQVQAQEVENFDVSAEPCDVEEDADSIYSGVLHS
ncbi:differentially expressed in FDCP 8 homolog A [Hyalella azteca]|nr:differentially expressed in FDCP 8 homolog A [Hyalella azteca]